MIAWYEVTSHRTRTENCNASGCSSHMRMKRIDDLTLALGQFKMPIRQASVSVIRGDVSSVMQKLQGHEDSVRALVIERSNTSEETERFEAEYLTAVCPFCGVEEELEHGRWSVFVEHGSKMGEIGGEPCAQGTKWFADLPSRWFDDPPYASTLSQSSEFIPIYLYNRIYCDSADFRVELPYSEKLPPLVAFEADGAFGVDGSQLSLFPAEEAEGTARRTYGRFGGYKGIYACQHCGCIYYVVYADSSGNAPISVPGHFNRRDEILPAEVDVVIESGPGSISLSFSPALEGRLRTICFDLDRGYTEVNGRQLMKTGRLNFDWLIPGFKCSKLVMAVVSMMNNSIGDADRSLQVLANSHTADICSGGGGSGTGLIDLAVINRWRGYPDSFYEKVLLVHRELRFVDFGILPVDYKDIDRAYALSGLPCFKSIRRLAFRQPLLIAYAASLKSIPFSDPNILKSLFESERALSILGKLASASYYFDMTLFEYLRETRGELTVWRYIAERVGSDNRLGFLSMGLPREMLDVNVRQLVDALPIDRAVRVLRDIFWTWYPERRASREYVLNPNEEYGYTPEQQLLEASVSGFDFILPATPLNMIEAGVKLRNCLTGYAARAGEEWEESTVVVIRRYGQPIAAVEVNVSQKQVVQAKMHHNKEMPHDSSLYEAFIEWLRDKGLEYN